MEDRLLKVKTVQEWTTLSRAKLYQLIQKGELPAIKIGKSVRVSKKDLMKFLREHRTVN